MHRKVSSTVKNTKIRSLISPKCERDIKKIIKILLLSSWWQKLYRTLLKKNENRKRLYLGSQKRYPKWENFCFRRS